MANIAHKSPSVKKRDRIRIILYNIKKSNEKLAKEAIKYKSTIENLQNDESQTEQLQT